MEHRRIIQLGNDASKPALEGNDNNICIAAPIVTSGDVSGAVILLHTETDSPISESDLKLISVAAAFLGKQIEG